MRVHCDLHVNTLACLLSVQLNVLASQTLLAGSALSATTQRALLLLKHALLQTSGLRGRRHRCRLTYCAVKKTDVKVYKQHQDPHEQQPSPDRRARPCGEPGVGGGGRRWREQGARAGPGRRWGPPPTRAVRPRFRAAAPQHARRPDVPPSLGSLSAVY